MKGFNNEYYYTFHNTYFSIRKIFPKTGLNVLKRDIRKTPLYHLLIGVFQNRILDWDSPNISKSDVSLFYVLNYYNQ